MQVMACSSMSGNKHCRYHYQENSTDTGIDTNTEKWYRYRRSVQIQKIVPIQKFGTNIGK